MEVNEKKLSSGKFHQDKVGFIGFEFYAGYFQINENKKQEFKKRIIRITHLTRKRPWQSIIKQLNNKILGFGHYYKFASVKQDFDELDSFIRQRLRRWLLKNKGQKERIGNLYLTNLSLKNLRLKSLADISTKYALKNKVIFKKSEKKPAKSGEFSKLSNLPKTGVFVDKIWFYTILKELRKITGRLTRIESKIARIVKKLNH